MTEITLAASECNSKTHTPAPMDTDTFIPAATSTAFRPSHDITTMQRHNVELVKSIPWSSTQFYKSLDENKHTDWSQLEKAQYGCAAVGGAIRILHLITVILGGSLKWRRGLFLQLLLK